MNVSHFLRVFGILVCLAAIAWSQEDTPAEAPVEPAVLFKQLQGVTTADERKKIYAALLTCDKPVIEQLFAYMNTRIGLLEQNYDNIMKKKLKQHYFVHLSKLNDEQINHIATVRRLWREYLLEPILDKDFRKKFLAPAKEASLSLIMDVAQLDDAEIAASRNAVQETYDVQERCKNALGINPDPTTGKKAPTGVAIPPLDSPPTAETNLSFLDRSLILAHSIAPAGAHKILLKNVEFAREIDTEESEFILYSNEIRMVMGTIAWQADPLACAATRDHSQDRKDGKASGHISTIPGKEGFVARLKRFGTNAGAEGAGGGRDGRNYLEGLSYAGTGHGGPLYSLRRNVIGVGRRDGVYTSVYATDKNLVHPCQVTTGEHFMPPGIIAADLPSSVCATLYKLIGSGQYGAADALLTRSFPKEEKKEVDAAGNETGDIKNEEAPQKVDPKTERATKELTMLRFFRAAVQAEVNWRFAELEALKSIGDVYVLKALVDRSKKELKGNDEWMERLSAYSTYLKDEVDKKELQAGHSYHLLANQNLSKDDALKFYKQISEKFKESPYAKAADSYLSNPEERNPFSYFLEQQPDLSHHGYPPKDKANKR